MGRRARVYVTQETNADFSGAEAWGQVIFITAQDFHNSDSSIANRALVAEIRRTLASYDPDLDWLVIAGSPYVAAAVFATIGLKTPTLTDLMVLRWDNRDRMYRPLRIPMQQWATNPLVD
jgi:hypothetical protein